MRGVIVGLIFCMSLTTEVVAATGDGCDKLEVLRPIMSTHILPPYPKASVEALEEGEVLSEVTIDAEGVPSDIKLITSSGYPALDEGVMAHLKTKWRWAPGPPPECPVRHTKINVTMDLRDVGVQAPPRVTHIQMVDADFPSGSGADEHGTTSIAMSIGGAGVLKKIYLLKSSGYRDLDSQAQNYARSRYSYSPGQMDGKPVYTLIYLDFIWPSRRN